VAILTRDRSIGPLARVACAVSAMVALSVRPAAAQHGLEYEVKAAFIYNFIQFVEWPPIALADEGAPFRVCVYGDDPFGPALERVVRGERLNGHPLMIERVAVGAAATQCHLLFVPQSQSVRAAAALRAAGAGPVLSVGESPDFLRSGGMINLFVDGGRVRFDVNVAAASAHGLAASSKLLRIARNTSEGDER
jgi:hypothetical protein